MELFLVFPKPHSLLLPLDINKPVTCPLLCWTIQRRPRELPISGSCRRPLFPGEHICNNVPTCSVTKYGSAEKAMNRESEPQPRPASLHVKQSHNKILRRWLSGLLFLCGWNRGIPVKGGEEGGERSLAGINHGLWGRPFFMRGAGSKFSTYLSLKV